ncbi:MAG: hypothetical protein JXD21_07470 [Candidatus Omnitrophica bacterium]|nr:hypothetical protein [Candidatus Omnitrophota bacterium]
MKKIMNRIIFIILLAAGLVLAGHIYLNHIRRIEILNQIIRRLEADSRIAHVLVTAVEYDENDQRLYTTIKFLEYDTQGDPLEPKYFTFSGNIIQFQSLVIRFDDIHIRNKDRLRGKSAYLFWKVFMLHGNATEEYPITQIDTVPAGYSLNQYHGRFERELWERFWEYALKPKAKERMGIKNAQIEAPGTMFVPGVLYTIKIEHDGGMRIDASPLPVILENEKLPEFGK